MGSFLVILLFTLLINMSELVPSSARSTSSSASPIPPQFVPLLSDALEKVKEVISKVLPVSKKLTALEEAEWEEDSEDGALEREMHNQGLLIHFSRRASAQLLDSHGDIAGVSPARNLTWTGWCGPGLCGTCGVALFRRLSCSES